MSKASKLRSCPAASREITVTECAAGRHTAYACPVTCPHDPFLPANYSRILEMEGKLDNKCMDRVVEQAPDRAALLKTREQMQMHHNLHAAHAWYVWQLFFAIGPDGLTFGQRWEKAGFSDLKGDQRVLLRAKMKTRVALLEIRRIVDEETIEAVDLLVPNGPVLVFRDRSLSHTAVRFATALTWIYPLPHFWRLSGTAIILPGLVQFAPEEIVREIVRHLGGPEETEALRRWLAENFLAFDNALQATARLRRMQMFAGMDANYGKAVYELKAPFAECRERLDALPDVLPEKLSDAERNEGFAESRVWLDGAGLAGNPIPDSPESRSVLGRVLLGQAHWRLEGIGRERFARLRQRFEACLGSAVRLTGERIDDMAASMAGKEPKVDEALVPPRLLEQPSQVVFGASQVQMPRGGGSPGKVAGDMAQALHRKFLDDQIPALNNKTPREAARDPALRPILLRLLKERVRAQDEENLRSGRTDDINWLLRELGTEEIIAEPPPWRPPLRPVDELGGLEDGEDGDLYDEVVANPNLPPPPPLPPKPFTGKQANKRLDEVMAAFDTALDAENALFESGSTLLPDADEMTANLLSEPAFSFTIPFLFQAWFALVPPGHKSPPINYERMERALERHCQEWDRALRSANPNDLIQYQKQSAQPELMLQFTALLLSSMDSAPAEIRPEQDEVGNIISLIRAAVDEADAAMRETFPARR